MTWNKSQDELKRLFDAGTPIVYAHKAIHEIYLSSDGSKLRTKIIKTATTPFTLRGRIHAFSELQAWS